MTHTALPANHALQPAWRWLWCALVGLTVAWPWLNPHSSGPNPNMVPLLVSALCALLLALGWSLGGWRVQPSTTRTALFGAWLVAALLASAMGLLQYAGLADTLSPWINHAPAGEAYANLRQRNQFASLTSIGLAALLYLAGRSDALAHGQARTLSRCLTLACITLLAMANAASSSRTGALQWLGVALLAAVWARPGQRQNLQRALLAVLLYAVATLALPVWLSTSTGVEHVGLLGRLQEPPGCESRRVLWTNVLELIAQKPWLGWGWGELKFAHFSHPYAGERFCAILDNAHNLPLQLAVELGVPVATAVCAVVGWWVWRRKPWRETDPAHRVAWTVLGIMALHSLVEYPLWYGPFQMALGLCLWTLCSPQARPAGTATAPPRSLPPGLAALAMGSFLAAWALLVYVAWDYTRISQLYIAPAQRLGAYRVHTLHEARASRLFAREVLFAEVTTTAVTQDTAPRLYVASRALLHFSPEPRVLQVLLESAQLLGVDDASTQQVRARFAGAYPQAFAQWNPSP